MNQIQLLGLLTSLTVLLAVVHLGGLVATRLRQPRVAGEILGGLLLGPTVLGALAPEIQRELFPASGPVAAALGGAEQLGLLMLMFLAGSETRRSTRRDGRLIGSIVVAGLVVPFAAGLALTYQFDLAAFAGPADSEAALGLVMAAAIAVTSIPVISRIMLDLGILGTSFATVVLSAAVVEDVVLYTVVAVALGIARAPGEAATGLPQLLGLDGGTAMAGVYYGAVVLLLFGLALRFGGALRGVLTGPAPQTELPAASATTRCVLLVLAGAAAAASLGIQPMFGAFLAGVVVARADAGGAGSLCASCRSFSLAFFLPLYFGSVGLKLDLIHDLDPALTLGVVGLACIVKLTSVYFGARIAGEARGPAAHLAAALNARGGPGIALATLTLGAGIIDKTLYTALIIVAVVTSLLAAAWLRLVVSRGLPLRTGERPVVPAQT